MPLWPSISLFGTLSSHFIQLSRVCPASLCSAFLLHSMFLFSQLWLVGEAHEKLSKCRTCNFSSSSAALRKTISFRVAAVRVFYFAVLFPLCPLRTSLYQLWLVAILECWFYCSRSVEKCLIFSCQRRNFTGMLGYLARKLCLCFGTLQCF